MTQFARTPDPDQARHDLYEIMQSDVAFEEKAGRALELGEAYLGVENGHLTRIDADDDYWEAIASTDPPDGEFPVGLVLDLNTTYCRRVIEGADSIALHDAAEQGWRDDPAFDTHGLHCYHGTPLTVDGEPWGSVCFVSKSPREEPFTDGDTMFAELIARMLEHELEHAQQEEKLNRRADLITVLSRVLRHNLRNDMTAIRGQLARITAQHEDAAELCEPLYRQIDDLISLSETARRFESVVDTKHEYYQIDLVGLTNRTIARLQPDYPTASFAVEAPDSVSVSVMGCFQRALEELIKNAAKHTRSDDPQVTVTIEDDAERVRIHIEDTGPGLPEQERAVLREGTERPLMHGSGLGLWLVYWIVTDHDGTIETEVTETGTRVTVAVPRASSQPELTDPTVLKRRFQREQDRFEAVFEQAFDPIVLFDDNGQYIDANPQAGELFGLPESELLGRSVEEFLPDDYPFESDWKEFQTTAQSRGTFPLLRADGEERTVRYATTRNIVPGQHLAVLRDITDEKAREEALRETTQRLEAIIGASPNPIFMLDTEGVVRLWNEAAERVFGYTENEAVGVRLPSLNLHDDAEAAEFEDRFKEVLAEEQYADFEVERRTKAGERVRVRLSTAPLQNPDGTVSGIVVVATELT